MFLQSNPLVHSTIVTSQLSFLQNNKFHKGKDCESALFTLELPMQGLVQSSYKINI